jgi:glutathione synthase/RimK-type ligase-like ATP-grasp enzyme
VIKEATGGMSRGVFLVKTPSQLKKQAKKISRTPHLKAEIKEKIREKIHKGYRKESKYQNKFIVQPFVEGLTNDWKVIIHGNHYYVLNRGIKGNDFRASGSGHDYRSGTKAGFPIHMLDDIEKIYTTFNVPHLSLDFAYDGQKGYILEYQAVYFGLATLDFSNEYFIKKENQWVAEQKTFDQEEEYVWGVVHYLKQHPELISE